MQAFSSCGRIFLLAKASCGNCKREEEMRRVRGAYSKGCYFYSPQSSSVIKSKVAATTIQS